jgi:flagellar hook-associated protein 2
MATAAAGVGTNLDVNSIVSQLMALERRPLAALARQESALQAQISAWGRLKGALSSLQAAARDLDSLERFRALKAAVGDSTLASAAAGPGAVPGTHSLEVIALAQQHKLRSDPFASASSAVGTGTLTFQYGTYHSASNTFTLNGAKAAQTLTIGAAQNTLAGIRDAVNAANIGVAASIVNDGGGERLVFTSKDSGAANSLRITVVDGDGTHGDTSGLSRLAYDPTAAAGSGRNLTQTAAAQDASLKIDGIAVTKSSNVVTDAIQGVTLTLAKAAPGTTTAVTVSRDADAVKGSIRKFVDAHNAAARVFKELMGYNAETKQAGQLQGDAVGLSIVSKLRGTLVAAVGALSGSLTSLSQVGVSFQKDGMLALDETKLQSAIDTSFEDIAGVFTRVLKTSSASVSYRGATSATRAGSYAVEVTQLATRGRLAGAQAAGLTITAGVNDAVTFTVDGVSASVTLAAGTYASASALAAELQSKINGAASLSSAGTQVAVTESSGVLSVTSARYGSASSVAATAGAAATNLFGAAPTATAGVDVSGTINGAAATGAGRTLTAAAGNAAEGLQIDIHASAPGSLGTVTYSIGYAARLSRLSDDMLAAGGAIDSRTEGLSAHAQSLGKRASEMNERLAAVERRYRAQFVALDSMLSRMNTTSTFLTQQLASLPAPPGK